MQIPTKIECYRLMLQTRMLENIMAHSLQVCRVATWIGEQLKHRGTVIDLDLVQAGALLHDITKTRSIDTGEIHSKTGGEFLIDLGYPEVGDIVRQHVKLDVYFESDQPSEAEIVNYADKRVLHDKIVSLQQRMDYILERYGRVAEFRDAYGWLKDKSVDLEIRIFALLQMRPESLENRLAVIDLSAGLMRIMSCGDSPAA
jgi:putative nucleotidyltransferase with HDIG domain